MPHIILAELENIYSLYLLHSITMYSYYMESILFNINIIV